VESGKAGTLRVPRKSKAGTLRVPRKAKRGRFAYHGRAKRDDSRTTEEQSGTLRVPSEEAKRDASRTIGREQSGDASRTSEESKAGTLRVPQKAKRGRFAYRGFLAPSLLQKQHPRSAPAKSVSGQVHFRDFCISQEAAHLFHFLETALFNLLCL
jgi:hypothetical protein